MSDVVRVGDLVRVDSSKVEILSVVVQPEGDWQDKAMDLAKQAKEKWGGNFIQPPLNHSLGLVMKSVNVDGVTMRLVTGLDIREFVEIHRLDAMGYPPEHGQGMVEQ